MKKVCIKCEKKKDISEFYKFTLGGKHYHKNQCKKCIGEYQKDYHKTKMGSDLTYRKRRYKNSSNYQKRRWKSDVAFREAHGRYRRKKRKNDPIFREKRNEATCKYFKKRTKEDPFFRLTRRVSTAVWVSLRDKKDGRCWESLVGYTLKDLIVRLELLFEPEMNWSNYGEWHVDHIKPRHLFGSSDEEFKKCWALENLQPLWAEDNLIKGASYEEGNNQATA